MMNDPYSLYTGLEDEEEEESAKFAFQGSGYYDEEGIWHDPEVEDAED